MCCSVLSSVTRLLERSSDIRERLVGLQGGLCASGSPLFSNKFELNPKELAFFRDDGSENTGGLVSRLRMWEKTLTHEEMATVSGCTLYP